MPQIINPGVGMGGSLAQSLGQGLQGGAQNIFQSMMQMKMLQMQEDYKRAQQERDEQNLQDAFARVRAASSEQQQNPLDLIDTLSQLSQGPQQQAQQPLAALQGLGQQQPQKPVNPFAPKPRNGMGIFEELLAPERALEQPGKALSKEAKKETELMKLGETPEEIKYQRQLINKALKEYQPSAMSRADEIEAVLQQPGIAPKQRAELRKMLVEERKLEHSMRKETDKETKAYYDKLVAGGKIAKDTLMDLDRMETMIKEGKLTGPLKTNFLKALGHSTKMNWLGILEESGSEEFEKLTYNFLRNIKGVFGGRISNMEVQNFLKTVPKLVQSDAGKLAIIHNLKIINEAENMRYEAGKRIIKANGGRRPANFELMVDEATKPQMDRLADQYKKGVERVTPELSAGAQLLRGATALIGKGLANYGGAIINPGGAIKDILSGIGGKGGGAGMAEAVETVAPFV